MRLEFVGRDRLEIVHGGLDRLSRIIELGTFSDVGATAIVVLPEDENGEFFVLTRIVLDRVLRLAGRGYEVRPLLDRAAAVPTANPDESPTGPAVAVEADDVVGVWLVAAPAQRRGFRRRGGVLDRTWDGVEAIDDEVAGGAGEPTIRTTPHLDAPDELATAPGESFEVKVYTSAMPFRPNEAGTDVVIDAPPEVTEVTIGAVLTVTDHFEVVGEPYRPLTIVRDEPESEALSFEVRVSDRPPPGNAGIQALFLYRGRPCGKVGREWSWDTDASTARSAPAASGAPTSIPVHTETVQPELSVIITAPVQDGTHFHCLVQTPLLDEYDNRGANFGLKTQASEYVKRMYAALVDEDRTPAQRRDELDVIGYDLFDASPPIFREALWALVDANRRPESIYIASVEPTLPWELMIPNRPPGPVPHTLRPLGVEFAIGRWTRADSTSPPQLMPVRDALVVAPEYKGRRKLETTAEVELIERRLRGTRMKPATKDYLKYYVGRNHASLLHFACHGAADVADDNAIYLDDDEVLRSGEVRAAREFQDVCADRAPLVFINACETGQLVPSLSGGAGFPYAFASIGARAVIAPLWPVDDTLAREIAVEIYETALQPDAPALAEIVRAIRQRAYEQTDADTYAAYCFYGDPLAKLTLAD